MRTGSANLPLHGGKAPAWLFNLMKQLAREVTLAVVEEFGPGEMIKRLSDPHWFQALGCVLGFDWHSSGVTTTVCGALKEGLKGVEKEAGIFVAGGKGAVSRKTPQEIEVWADRLSIAHEPLVYASRMSAKVDSAAVQDGYQLYHHVTVFDRSGEWCVVQQGMNGENRYARRYHWLSDQVEEFVNEPHAAVCCDTTGAALNMVAGESKESRSVVAELAKERPEKLISEFKRLPELTLPARHQVEVGSINPKRLQSILVDTYERQPENFEVLLGMRGVGGKTIRSLALLGELLYGSAPSFADPARYSFAHGGKDGFPYPVDRENYRKSIDFLRKAVSQSKVGQSDKMRALKRLGTFERE
ncbi:MAG: DUF763 domain-containing protein [Candidatus Aquicultorales bacterium]